MHWKLAAPEEQIRRGIPNLSSDRAQGRAADHKHLPKQTALFDLTSLIFFLTLPSQSQIHEASKLITENGSRLTFSVPLTDIELLPPFFEFLETDATISK